MKKKIRPGMQGKARSGRRSPDDSMGGAGVASRRNAAVGRWERIGFWFAIAALALIIGYSFAESCQWGVRGGGDQKGLRTQEAFSWELEQARKGLFAGRISYSVVRDAAEGDIQRFELRVGGARAAPSVGPSGDAKPGAAQIGALMGAKLHCAGVEVKCTQNSSERQPILTPKDSAQWNWSISTPKAGKVSVTLTLTAYYLNTNTVLAEGPPVEQTLEVKKEESFWEMLSASWNVILTLLAAVGGLGGVVAFIAHWTGSNVRNNDQRDQQQGTPPPPAAVEEDPDQPPGPAARR
ncbi:hypothetical protein [Streptomyces rimosus]|uniref:hypothetical protein n=1 Tax=Streptomyces rimosus TaxID=1927 RepID=UPI0037D4BA2A